MNTIDTHQLLAYLYGELGKDEATLVEHRLATQPEVQEAFTQLQATHKQLQQLQDVPVTEPLVFTSRVPAQMSFAWQKWAAVAAVLVAGLLAAAWLQVRIRYENQELSIRFGEPPAVKVAPLPSVAYVPAVPEPQKTVTASSSEAMLQQKLADLEKRLQEQIQQVQQQQQKRDALPASNDQLTGMLNQMQQDNYQLMQQLVTTSAQQQQQYSEQLLNQLTYYLAHQREDDLQQINTVLNTIVQSTDQNQQQTDLMLTQLIARLQENEKNRSSK